MRCELGPKKIRRLSDKLSIDIVRAMTRGNTNHRIDILTRDGTSYHYWPDSGTIGEADLSVYPRAERHGQP